MMGIAIPDTTTIDREIKHTNARLQVLLNLRRAAREAERADLDEQKVTVAVTEGGDDG